MVVPNIDSAACKEIVTLDMSRYKFLPEKFYEQVSAQFGYHYRLLAWLSTAYNRGNFLELGTRYGIGAICMAYNANTKVETIEHKPELTDLVEVPWDKFPNIKRTYMNAAKVAKRTFDHRDVILMDLSHTGEAERVVLSRINKSRFKGLLIMDDIDWWKFPEMRKIWAEIDKPKRILPYAHHTGTGLVYYA